MSVTQLPKFFDEATAAEKLGIGKVTLARIRQKREIRFSRPSPRKILYCDDYLNEYRLKKEVAPCLTDSSSENTGSRGEKIPKHGAAPGSTSASDKLAAVHLAQQTLSKQKSILPSGTSTRES